MCITLILFSQASWRKAEDAMTGYPSNVLPHPQARQGLCDELQADLKVKLS